MIVLLDDPKHHSSLITLEHLISFLKEEKMDVKELNYFKRNSRVGESITYHGMTITRLHQSKAKTLKTWS